MLYDKIVSQKLSARFRVYSPNIGKFENPALYLHS